MNLLRQFGDLFCGEVETLLLVNANPKGPLSSMVCPCLLLVTVLICISEILQQRIASLLH